MECRPVALLDIAVIGRQRKRMDESKLDELIASIGEHGLHQPIVLRDPRDGEDTRGKPYVLCAGGRRFAAHIKLGKTTIDSVFKGDLDPLSAAIAELEENLCRENLSWQDEVDAREEIARLLAEKYPGMSQSDQAAFLGVSQPQLSKDLALAKDLKQNPALRLAETKGSAIRQSDYVKDLGARLEHLEKTSGNLVQDIKSRLTIGDARNYVRTLPSDSIDMVFTDLPYGIDYYEVAATSGEKATYDDSAGTTRDLIADLVPQILRVVKPTGWVVLFMCYEWHGWLMELIHDTCKVHYHYRDDQSKGICLDQLALGSTSCDFFRPELPPWIWNRSGSGNHGHYPELHAANRYDLIIVANGGYAKLIKKPVENVLNFPSLASKGRDHEMQKPPELCQELISRCTLPGETVLDLCFGSGAHLAAAASLGRNYLGCELNPKLLGPAISLIARSIQVPSTPARGALYLER